MRSPYGHGGSNAQLLIFCNIVGARIARPLFGI